MNQEQDKRKKRIEERKKEGMSQLEQRGRLVGWGEEEEEKRTERRREWEFWYFPLGAVPQSGKKVSTTTY